MVESTATPPATVILWVHPRSCSTMFECAILQRPDDFEVLHEPMGDAFYFGPERISKRYSPEQCAKEFPHYAEATFKKTWENVIKPNETKRTFSKGGARRYHPSALERNADVLGTLSDMAQYICNQASSTDIKSVPSLGPVDPSNPTLIPKDSLLSPSVIHTFLIRTPSKAVPSYHRLCYPGSPTGFEYWDPEETGLRELRLLFDYIRKQTGRTPLVLDSEDLLADPEGIMKVWCDEVQVRFDPSMLEWNEGTREHFVSLLLSAVGSNCLLIESSNLIPTHTTSTSQKKWPGFHTSAEASKGVGKGLSKDHITPSNHGTPNGETPKFPDDVVECIVANTEDYEYLRGFVKKA
ncbi:BZ3500_MvSof-1268-A1-R1_Chr3-1g06118 [Microbotryum saponariae]|uniref:BZ3500_MvSof-1268-A1-R1_Chr3-1g06118 protein n=1 Tax=Microbotryum saponariae TaxID=289078 RepID=A0A2X0LAQ3_9BASI|nr:BZ3500_MvSof-1268-A1-R1_Chr3-1g06118 [Microbotryum saponariae]SDA03981.1 BZ3501_MvSof-1269-A2-R1_Chr3-2g05803 [Microbotryum saponariae]